MSRNNDYVSRNVFERANGYPSRFGTARRDEYGQLRDGEFDGKGRRMKTAADGLESGAGLTPQDQWDKMFPGQRGGGTGDATATARTTAFSAAGATGAGARNDINGAGGDVPPGGVVTSTAAPAPDDGPGIGSTRRTAFGSTETFMPSSSGGRWVGSTSGAVPPANNMRPGQSATASLAEHRTVRMNPFTPVTGPEGNAATDRANLDRGLALARSPIDRPELAHKDSPEIQAMLDGNSTANQQAHAAIAANGGREGAGMTPYGPVAVQSKDRMEGDRLASKKAPAAGRNASGGTMPALPAPVVANPAPAAAPGTRPNPFVPAVPPVAAVPRSTYSPTESPSDAYARQQSRVKPNPNNPGAPFYGTTSPVDALKKGNLTAFGNWSGATARVVAGKAADAMENTGAKNSRAQAGLEKFAGRTASGTPVVPVKPARIATAKRPDKVQKAAWNN